MIAQLDCLLQEFRDAAYLQGFFDMVNMSVATSQAHGPDAYATLSFAIVGKSAALVNIGYSLELADPQNRNWSTVNTEDPDRHLLKPNG